MKRCPYCAEEIQDAAIKCRWCGSDLTLEPNKVVASPPSGMTAGAGEMPAAAPSTSSSPPATGEPAAASGRVPEILSPPRTPSPSPDLTFTHEGPRFLLGYAEQYYGIWDKQAPGPPTARYPRTDQGWQQAWEAFIRQEMAP